MYKRPQFDVVCLSYLIWELKTFSASSPTKTNLQSEDSVIKCRLSKDHFCIVPGFTVCAKNNPFVIVS